MTPIALIQTLNLNDIPDAVKEQAKLSILDLIGIGAGGAGTRLSAIIREHAAQEFGGTIPMLFDGRTASAQGAALAAGMTIDSLDGHDGFNMAKGHIGAPCSPQFLRWDTNNRFQDVRFCWQSFWAMNLAHARRWHNMQPPQIITHQAVGAPLRRQRQGPTSCNSIRIKRATPLGLPNTTGRAVR